MESPQALSIAAAGKNETRDSPPQVVPVYSQEMGHDVQGYKAQHAERKLREEDGQDNTKTGSPCSIRNHVQHGTKLRTYPHEWDISRDMRAESNANTNRPQTQTDTGAGKPTDTQTQRQSNRHIDSQTDA